MKNLIELIKSLSRPLEPLPTGVSPLLPEGPAPQAVIFDIYGTLFISAAGDIGKDSAEHSAEAFRQALKDAGIILAPDDSRPSRAPEIFRQEILNCHRRLRGRGVDYPEVDICEIWGKVLAELGITGEFSSVTHDRIMSLAVSYECRTNPVWPMPGADILLDFLKQKEIRTGIISNAQFYTPLMFEALLGKGIRECGFEEDLCTWSWRAGAAKPSLTMFQPVHRALKDRYGIMPESILYVGNDILKDILPASSLGWKTALFAGDGRSLRMRKHDPRTAETSPWCIITELLQIISLLP